MESLKPRPFCFSILKHRHTESETDIFDVPLRDMLFNTYIWVRKVKDSENLWEVKSPFEIEGTCETHLYDVAGRPIRIGDIIEYCAYCA